MQKMLELLIIPHAPSLPRVLIIQTFTSGILWANIFFGGISSAAERNLIPKITVTCSADPRSNPCESEGCG